MNALVLLASGLGAGLLGSCLGVGGGVILVPILTIITGSPHQAIGTSLAAIIGVHGSATLFHLREAWVDMKIAFLLGSSMVLGAIIGAIAAGFVPGKALGIMFAGVALYVATTMFLPARRKPETQSDMLTGPKRKPLGVLLGGFVGMISGMLGIGGGIMNVPVMHLVMGVPTKRAIATSSFLIGTAAGPGAIIYLARGDVLIQTIPPVVIGIIIGALAGAWIARRARPRWLRAAFGILLLYTAAQMLWKILT
ncbi:MAG: sulfite exporter TauE/SafE family protein [candidate division WOR-3 bacterium]